MKPLSAIIGIAIIVIIFSLPSDGMADDDGDQDHHKSGNVEDLDKFGTMLTGAVQNGIGILKLALQRFGKS